MGIDTQPQPMTMSNTTAVPTPVVPTGEDYSHYTKPIVKFFTDAEKAKYATKLEKREIAAAPPAPPT